MRISARWSCWSAEVWSSRALTPVYVSRHNDLFIYLLAYLLPPIKGYWKCEGLSGKAFEFELEGGEWVEYDEKV
jgi:hypothetical protein